MEVNHMYYGNEFYHHGIKNQRWGVRNGPPYPLTPEAKRKTKEQAVSEGSAKDMMPYLNDMSNKELIDALNRVQWMARIEDEARKQNPDFMKKLISKVDSVSDRLKHVKDWTQTAFTLYLLVDRIVNSSGNKKK